MAIQLFQPKFHTEECLEEIRECLEKGWTGIGFKTTQFEEAWKEYTGYSSAHFLNSATAGLHLAVKILKETDNWNDESEIISTPLTFISTNHAISYENLKVVFADIDEFLCLDPVDVERKITKNTKAIMFVGLGGNTGQWKQIVNICKRYNLKLILDAAHMAGTRLDGSLCFKDADVVIYSFQAVKNLPTADSGMICFKDNKLDKIARKMSWLGINKDTYSRSTDGNYKFLYDVESIGYKYHGNSIMAAIGLVQLKYLDEDNQYRNKVAELYDQEFLNNQNIKKIPIGEGCQSSRHLYIVEVDKRNQLIDFLNKNQIYPGVHYINNINYNMYSYAKNTCLVAETIDQRILSLPIHLNLTEKDIQNISTTINNFTKDLA